MDPIILFKYICVKEEIEEARRILVQNQQNEEAKMVDIGTNYNHVVDSMEEVEGLEIFLEARPGWSGTIEVKSSNEEEYKGVINFKGKYWCLLLLEGIISCSNKHGVV